MCSIVVREIEGGGVERKKTFVYGMRVIINKEQDLILLLYCDIVLLGDIEDNTRW